MEKVNIITTSVDVKNKCLAAFKINDDKINELFSKIEDLIDKSHDTDSKKIDILISTEYLVTKIRTIVTTEQLRVNQLLVSEATEVVKAIFKQRNTYLGIVNQRLNELREDASTIQKLIHTKNFQNTFK